MKAEVKKEWLEALRSGKYKQGIEMLERDGRFCCLGVLCSLAVEHKVIDRKLEESSSDQVAVYGSFESGDRDMSDAALPAKVMQWAGLDSSLGNLLIPINVPLDDQSPISRAVYTCLAELNDSETFTFAQIADIIEEQF